MSKECRLSNDETRKERPSTFVLRHSFVIRHSTFVIILLLTPVYFSVCPSPFAASARLSFAEVVPARSRQAGQNGQRFAAEAAGEVPNAGVAIPLPGGFLSHTPSAALSLTILPSRPSS